MAIINGTPGDDNLTGTPGDDIITTFTGNDTVDAGDGDDVIIVTSGSSAIIDGGVGYDVIQIDAIVNAFIVNAAGEITGFQSNGASFAMSNIEAIESYDANDNLVSIVLLGNAGDDTLDLSTYTGVTRSAGYGGGGNDIIIGSNIRDYIWAGDGVDSISAGDGDDIITGSDGSDHIDGGAGIDLIAYASSDTGVSVNLLSGIGTNGLADGDTYASIEYVRGSEYDDTIIGNTDDNTLEGLSGDDLMYGGNGDDILFGGFGDDELFGGEGDDVLFIQQGTDELSGGTGADTFQTLSTIHSSTILDFSIDDNIYVRSFSAIPTFIGTASFSSTALELRYEKIGGETHLQFDADGDGIIDETIIIANGEFDLSQSSASNGYRLTIDGIVGTPQSDNLIGTSDGENIYALEDNDIVDGMGGNDFIYGVDGNDILRGGDGDDAIFGGNGNDFLRGDAGADALDGGAGFDWADYRTSAQGVTVHLLNNTGTGGDAQGDKYTDIEGLYGSAQDDFLRGDAGTNFLRGEAGDDQLYGGFGTDYLRGGAGADIIHGGAGSDWADYSTSSAAVTVNLLTNVNTGGDAQGDTITFAPRVLGSSHNDDITGDTGVNYLRGLAGDDILRGGDGNDYLQGDAGADQLFGGNGQDWAYYVSSAAGVTVNLAANTGVGGTAQGDTYNRIENVFGSKKDDHLIGDTGANFLRGNDGIDTLEGGAGDDFLRGDKDSDILIGGNGNDWAYYATADGAVTVDLATGMGSGSEAQGDTYTSIERVFGSTHDDKITGDAGSNYLRGYRGDDELYGNDGIDFLQGGKGADKLFGGNGSDWAYYVSASEGQTIDLSNNANNLGSSADGDTYDSIENVWGSRYDDIIVGDAGDNILRGGNGEDVITGGEGEDTLRGEAGGDTFVFQVGTGKDTVIDFNDNDDFLAFEDYSISTVNDIMAAGMQSGNDVIFQIDGDTIVVMNAILADLADNIIV